MGENATHRDVLNVRDFFFREKVFRGNVRWQHPLDRCFLVLDGLVGWGHWRNHWYPAGSDGTHIPSGRNFGTRPDHQCPSGPEGQR